MTRRFGNDINPAVDAEVTNGLVNKHNLLIDLGRDEDAMIVHKELDQRSCDDDDIDVSGQVA